MPQASVSLRWLPLPPVCEPHPLAHMVTDSRCSPSLSLSSLSDLRPSEDCQKDIDQSVDTICEVLQEPCPSLTVTGVAKVSRWLGSVLLRPKGQKDLVLSTCCVLGPGYARHHLV